MDAISTLVIFVLLLTTSVGTGETTTSCDDVRSTDVTGYSEYNLGSDISDYNLDDFTTKSSHQESYGDVVTYVKPVELYYGKITPAYAQLVLITLNGKISAINYAIGTLNSGQAELSTRNAIIQYLSDTLSNTYADGIITNDERSIQNGMNRISTVYEDSEGDMVWLRGFPSAIVWGETDRYNTIAMVYYSTKYYQDLFDNSAIEKTKKNEF